MVTFQELLGTRIRICIEKAGDRTVEEFAFAFGIGKSTLSDILTGKKSPTVSTLARWANALEIPIGDFFEDDRLNHWVREAPPAYFQNRGKSPGGTGKPKSRPPAKPPKTAGGKGHRASLKRK
jgi:transcriptional regulator with XRE-family HTH domain